jgi:hypothetical protein
MNAAQKNIVVVSEVKIGLGAGIPVRPARSLGFLVKATVRKMPVA